MPQIQMTRSVRIALVVLRVYLVIMLALILIGFLRREKAVTQESPAPAPAASTAPATPGAASIPAARASAPAAAVNDLAGKP